MTPHYSSKPVIYRIPRVPLPTVYPPPPPPPPPLPFDVEPPPPGVACYPSPYGSMIQPAFPLLPLAYTIRGPIIPPFPRPYASPSITPAIITHSTIYIGKISPTVEDDFIISLLQLCGSVKNWKRPRDPTGNVRGFGFCEFESVEGVLRALRLLKELPVDGQELMLTVNQTTREYIQSYVEKKIESSKNVKDSGTEGELRTSTADTDGIVKSSKESLKPSLDGQKKNDNEGHLDVANFGLVTDEEKEADIEALEKIRGMIEERLRSKPLLPPLLAPQMHVDGPSDFSTGQPFGSRDCRGTDKDVSKNDPEDRSEDEKTSESKPSKKIDSTDPVLPDKNKRRGRRTKRAKTRERERREREMKHERAKREKNREYKSRDDRYQARKKEWEAREKERHKTSDKEYKRRQKEKEEDLADRLREQAEMAEAEMRFDAERMTKLHDPSNVMSAQPANIHENEINLNGWDNSICQTFKYKLTDEVYEGEGVLHNGRADKSLISSNAASNTRENSNAPSTRLVFRLSRSWKRATVPSIFNEDENEDKNEGLHKEEKKMKPLVPSGYSTEEQQGLQSSASDVFSANLAATSNMNVKEVKLDGEKDKSRRSHERITTTDQDRHEGGTYSSREGSRNNNCSKQMAYKPNTPENPEVLDSKQLIDTIPKTKEGLFTYPINWAIYDQNALHETMRPWISQKITDFLGEEEGPLVDYIVSNTQEHVRADDMLERLEILLDDEAETLVLKMWSVLIFEIKKVESGLVPMAKI